MSVADWESKETGEVLYEAAPGDGRKFRLKVDRNAKVSWLTLFPNERKSAASEQSMGADVLRKTQQLPSMIVFRSFHGGGRSVHGSALVFHRVDPVQRTSRRERSR